MVAGIQVFNTFNTIQVDEQYKNLALASKFTLASTTAWPTASAASYVEVAVTSSEFPVLAFSGSIYVSVVSTRTSGTTTYFTVAFNGPVGSSVTCYVFDTPVAVLSGVGIQVFNAAGQATYDSNSKYLLVEDFKLASASTTATYNGYDSSRTYAVLTSAVPYQRVLQGGPPLTVWLRLHTVGVARTISDGFEVTGMMIGQDSASVAGNPANPFPPGSINGAFTLIDVTNY